MIGLFSFLNCNETKANKSGSEAGDLNEDFFAFYSDVFFTVGTIQPITTVPTTPAKITMMRMVFE